MSTWWGTSSQLHSSSYAFPDAGTPSPLSTIKHVIHFSAALLRTAVQKRWLGVAHAELGCDGQTGFLPSICPPDSTKPEHQQAGCTGALAAAI